MNALMSLPEWAYYLIQGLSIFALLAVSAVVAGRAGRSPYWALLVIVPFVVIIPIWMFAFSRWPAVDDAPKPDTAMTDAETARS